VTVTRLQALTPAARRRLTAGGLLTALAAATVLAALLAAPGQSHPIRMRRAATSQDEMSGSAMDEYKERLRRLALHDDTFLGLIVADESTPSSSLLGSKTAALVRVAATIAIDAAPSSFHHTVEHALAAGARCDEIVAVLEAVTPVTGAVRVVSAAPKLALALGYDVEDALEHLDQ
jgi:4-carboxymuconolactone decarboxylase